MRVLILARCLDCPHSEKVRDPGSDDSFDQFDQAMICKLTGPVKLPDRTFEHRPIVRCERSSTGFNVPIPDWCPLPEEKKKKKGKK